MSIYRMSKLIHLVRTECYEPCTKIPLKKVLRISVKQRFSSTDTTQHKGSPWQGFGKRWEWAVPVGVGVSLLAILQWRHLMKHPHPTQNVETYERINNFMVKFYCSLPLRISSRIWGWIASIELPVSLRPVLYGFYAKAFHAKLDEIDVDLSSFPSLVDFFVRPLKHDVRPIDQKANIVSPSDGKILHFGPVTSCRVEQVKGITYDLRHFLGDINVPSSNQPNKVSKEDDDTYVKTLLKNPTHQLYQLIIYLAPGDYHRFHSPADWEIEFRRHFQGKLLSVNPKIVSFLPDLFCLNERVTYIGKWTGGFMAYTAVGATNVGSIRVYCDQELQTNTIKWPMAKYWSDANLGCARCRKGELFGEFRMGSTIVLLFEAPKDFVFSIKIGDFIKVGQAITQCTVNCNGSKSEHIS